jgi:branched-subunit amino acid aminotransferase/4-amino-4-deoxychorismate lyase
MDEPLVYLNGAMLPASQAHLSVFDAGVVQGATVTEMTRTFGHRPFRLGAHLDRLIHSLGCAGMDAGLSRNELTAISQKLIAHNARLIAERDDLGLIQFVTAGPYPTFAGMARDNRQMPGAPTVCVHTIPLPFELWAKKMRAGVHLVTPGIRHIPPECLDPSIKNRSRMNYYLADKEARQVDPEASALLLDLRGHITETSTANFLMVADGVIVSPSPAQILPGISRTVVSELAARLGIPFQERNLQVADAIHADEAFLSSTPYCLMPVTKINGAPIADGRPGPVYRRLLDAWSHEVGLDIARQCLGSTLDHGYP